MTIELFYNMSDTQQCDLHGFGFSAIVDNSLLEHCSLSIKMDPSS